MTRALLAFVALCFVATTADARPRHTRPAVSESIYCPKDQTYRQTCGETVTRASTLRNQTANGNEAVIIGGRPSGCPRKYCGCGAARYLGLTDKRLNLAWNWARLFPRARAGAGMAVVWRHHVALIVEMVGPKEARLRDYNSGGGLSRVHVRSIAGAVVVNPHSQVASR